ncbi:MAG: N-(5'-phosphoribosyl)anthranilate isomerase, partial [Pseudorhodobacter sp.]|nr:N-(5'-phosphoribosyl)anthranilate isomerase [Rhizobacter sp.]
MHRTRIKICGLTRETDVEAAVNAGADAIGFVLYAASARSVSVTRAAELIKYMPAFVTPILLLVNASEELLAQALV